MPLINTEQMLGEINTISIPTDAILTVSLLIVFGLIGYFFNKILSNETNQFAQKIDAHSKLKLVKEELEDRLALEVITLDQKNLEKPNIKKLNFLPHAKSWGFGTLAILGMGGASLLGLQNMQKSYEGVSTSQAKIKLEKQSINNQLSVIDFESFYKTQKNIKKISSIDPFFSTINSSKDNHDYQVKEKQSENTFYF